MKAASSESCLFAYGTLLAPELRASIIGQALSGEAALLRDFVCYRVKRAAYPAITHSPGAVTEGEVFESITTDQWRHLDAYESSLYERIEVEVELPCGHRRQAMTYVINGLESDRLSQQVWDYARFRERHLDKYLKTMHEL